MEDDQSGHFSCEVPGLDWKSPFPVVETRCVCRRIAITNRSFKSPSSHGGDWRPKSAGHGHFLNFRELPIGNSAPTIPWTQTAHFRPRRCAGSRPHGRFPRDSIGFLDPVNRMSILSGEGFYFPSPLKCRNTSSPRPPVRPPAPSTAFTGKAIS